MSGVRQIFLAKEHAYRGRFGQEPVDAPMEAVSEVRCVAGKGLEGDRFFELKEDFKGQVTFFDQAALERMQALFPGKVPSAAVFRRNVVVEGMDLPSLVGKEFEVQGVRFLGTEEAKPCPWMNHAVEEGAEEALKECGGLRAKILSDGLLQVERVEQAEDEKL